VQRTGGAPAVLDRPRHTDEARVREVTEKMEMRYLGAVPPEFEEALWFEGRTVVIIEPQRWLAWDQSKSS